MRRSRLVVAGVVVVLFATAYVGWRIEHRGPAHPSLSGAIDRFRTSSTTATPAANWTPRPGVYVYDGRGTESLSFLSTHQSEGPREPGTVTLLPDGCWQFRIDFNSFHSQTWNRCAAGTKLLESGGTTDQRFDFVAFRTSEHSDVTCDPPMVVADRDAAAGATRPAHCTGHAKTTNSTMTQTGTTKFVGREQVDVGGVAVAAFHTREDFLLSGGQTGEVHVDIWFAEEDALPLKETHDIRVTSPAPAPLNHVTYTEEGSWQLTSLQPTT